MLIIVPFIYAYKQIYIYIYIFVLFVFPFLQHFGDGHFVYIDIGQYNNIRQI